MESADTWINIIGLIGATGALTLAWTTAMEWVKAKFARDEDAAYLAMRTAVALEAYAIECWRRLMIAKGNFELTRGRTFEGLPPHPDLPTDVRWQVMKLDLAAKIFTFLNDTAIAEAFAEYADRFEGNEFDFESATQKRGRAAWELADEIRKAYELPQLEARREQLSALE